jgi:hypothetical protein
MSRLPILDKSHPINRKCVFAWDARLAQQNLVDGRLGTQTSNVSLGVAPGSILGRKFTQSGTYQSSQINFGLYVPTNFLHGSPATWLFYTNIASASNIALACQTDSDSSKGWQVGTSGGRLYLGLVRSSTDIRKTINDNALTGIHKIAITYDGTETNTGIHIYVDGIEQTYYASSGPSGTTGANTTDPLLLGTQRWETSQSYGGTIFNARFYQRVLSTAEISIFSKDPYVGYVRPSSISAFGQFIYSGDGVELATGSALEVGSGTQTQTGSLVELATGSALEFGGDFQGSLNEIATGSALEVGSGTQIQTGSSAELATGSALEAGSGTQVQTGSSAELATGSALEAGLGTQTQTGSSVELATGSALESGLGTQTQTGNLIETATGSALEFGFGTQYGNLLEVSTGSVIVSGTGYAPPLPTFQAHQLNSKSVRLYFDTQLSDSILDSTYYTITSLASPGMAIVPSIESITFYDTTLRSIVINFSSSLTSGTSYYIVIDGAFSLTGMYIFAVNDFDANTIDPPRATRAFLSKRGAVDILFNKPVGPYSSLAIFSIRSAAGGPSTLMSQLPWAGEDIPDTTLRVRLPPGMATANSFVISFTNVIDESLNSSSEIIPLTLVLRTSPPYSYADLTQLQITDAFVTDVSPDVFKTANVRVFFSCPVDSSVRDELNWGLYVTTGHQQLDTVNYLTAGPASDLPSLILLVNDVKSKMNGHLSIDQVHFSLAVSDTITNPDAYDLNSSVILINEIGSKLYSHFMRDKVHLYLYDQFSFIPIGFDDLDTAMNASYLIASMYDTHSAYDEYQLSFSSAYQSPINSITAYTQELIPDAAFDVESPYTYFADLKVNFDSDVPPITITASLTSEDGISSIYPWDYGRITARSASTAATITSYSTSVDEWVEINTDRDVSVVVESPLIVTNPVGKKLPTSFSIRSSLPTLFWAFNNALESFRCHIIHGAAGHQTNDTTNIITSDDYAMLPLSGAMSSVNEVRSKIINHISSAIFHYHSDPINITAPSATDFDSLMSLILDIVFVLSSHLVKTGPHLYPGYRMISAPVRDRIRISIQGMINGDTHTVSGFFQDEYIYNGLPATPAPSNAVSKHHLNSVNFSFIGLAMRPSISSVLPVSGLITSLDESVQFGSDHLEVYFSKPMRSIPINSSNLPISGGLIQKESMWISPFVASISVTKMTTASYSISAIGLTDEAGNLVYP